MKKYLIVFTAALAAFLMFSCAERGPAGAAGTAADGWLSMSFQDGVYPSAAYTGSVDSRILDGNPNTIYGTDTESIVGYQTPSFGHKRLLINFDITYLPEGAAVKKAVLTLYTGSTVRETPSFAFYSLTQDWVEAESTWNNYAAAGTWAAAGGDYTAGAISNVVTVTSTAKAYSWEITPSVVQGWIDYPGDTPGIIMIMQGESTATVTTDASFCMSENATAGLRPKFTVYYTIE